MPRPNKYVGLPSGTRAKGKTYEKQAAGYREITPKPSQADYTPSTRPQRRRAALGR